MLPTRSQLYFVLFLCLFTVYYDTRLCPLGCLSYVLWRDHRFMGTTLIPLSSERKFGENCAAEVVVGCIYVYASRPPQNNSGTVGPDKHLSNALFLPPTRSVGFKLGLGCALK